MYVDLKHAMGILSFFPQKQLLASRKLSNSPATNNRVRGPGINGNTNTGSIILLVSRPACVVSIFNYSVFPGNNALKWSSHDCSLHINWERGDRRSRGAFSFFFGLIYYQPQCNAIVFIDTNFEICWRSRWIHIYHRTVLIFHRAARFAGVVEHAQ